MSPIRIRFDHETAYTRDWLADNEVEAQRVLATFKAKDVIPRCECNDKLPPMYIAHRTRYYLARNPGTGTLHSPECPSFEMEKEDSGRITYESDVIKPKNDGTLSLKILAPLAHKIVDRSPKEANDIDAMVPPRPKSPTAKREAMSLTGLLALMWEEAELNRWHPGFHKRRIWAVARTRLLDVAQRLNTKRINVADVLYIPEHFNESQKDAIDARRKDAFKRIMTKTSTVTKYMMVVGGIRKISVQEKSVAITLRHQSESVKYWGSQHVLKKLNNGPALEILGNINDPRLIYTLMIVSRDIDEVLHIQDIGFLVTDIHMIPTYCEQDRLMTEKLVMEGHKFIKTMRYDGSRDSVFPDYLLVDNPNAILPMAIFRTFASETAIEQRHQSKERWKEKYGKYWIWDMEKQGESVPDLPTPPATRTDSV